MATGTQVPFTDVGGTPCCCDAANCTDAFNSTFWAEESGGSRGVTESQCNLITLPSGVGASIFAGGTFNGQMAGVYTLNVLAPASGSFGATTTTLTVTASVNANVTTTANSCTNSPSSTSPSLGFSATVANASKYIVASANRCPTNGTFFFNGTINQSVSYQLYYTSGVWKAYLSAYFSLSSGTRQMGGTPNSGSPTPVCTRLQMGGAGITRNAYSGGGGHNYTFCGVTAYTVGTLVNNFSSNYGQAFVSGSLSFSTNAITFTPSAP